MSCKTCKICERTSSASMLLLLVVCLEMSAATNVNVLWMATSKFVFFFNASTSLGSLAYSMHQFNNTQNLSFFLQYEDSMCDSRQAIGRLFSVYENKSFVPSLILGPICSSAMEPVALLASHLNKPVFGWISSDPNLNDKTVFTTLVRTLWPISNLAEGVIYLCQLTKWKRVYLIATDSSDEGTLGDTIYASIIKTNITITTYTNDISLDPPTDDIKQIFTKLKTEARIVILSVPIAELRKWALAIYDMNMHGGDYAFVYVNQQTATEDVYNQLTSKTLYVRNDGQDDNVQKALQNFFLIFAKTAAYDKTNQLLGEFNNFAYTTNLSAQLGVRPAPPDFYSLFLNDALTVYTKLVNVTGSHDNGSVIFNAARSSVTSGEATGNIVLDNSCDRTPDYYYFKMGYNHAFDVVAETSSHLEAGTISRTVKWLGTVIWGNGLTGIENAPLDEPKCGFDNDKCVSIVVYIVPPVVVVFAAAVAVVLGFCVKNILHERRLASIAWKLNYSDIVFKGNGRAFGSQGIRAVSTNLLNKSRVSIGAGGESLNGQVYITRGEYRGTAVAIKTVRKQRIIEDQKLRDEMGIMLGLKHNNVNAFIGASITPPNFCTVWEYCTKGSLQDVVYNDAIQLDDMFKFSICIDLLKGLEYIHGSRLKVHGRLKSSNVILDGRWVCKLTDYGLTILTTGQEPADEEEESDYVRYSRLYWTAPEVLRTVDLEDPAVPLDELRCYTASGDIYSVGITLKELFTRTGPYTERDSFTPQDIVGYVRQGSHPDEAGGSVFRPQLSDMLTLMTSERKVINKMMKVIEQLWSEDPKRRPSCHSALTTIIKINPSKNKNVTETMIAMLEQYSRQLEDTVEIRKKQLEEEQKKTELLLYRMLPRSVADKLKLGLEVESEAFDSVTIYFSDITGFQSLAAECSPFEVVDILNGVYSLFDTTIPNHDVYKVETISDTYVMVSGLPQRNGDLHIVEIANCALELISRALNFNVPHRPNHKLRMRIGIHTGPIVAGVVGLAMPRYCLFGDTMNTTSRMESHGHPMRIHLSPTAKDALSKFAGYNLANRGIVTIKGKGDMNTYWLIGRVGYSAPLPDYKTEFQLDSPPPTLLPTTTAKALRPSIESGFAEDYNSLDRTMDPGIIVKDSSIVDMLPMITTVAM